MNKKYKIVDKRKFISFLLLVFIVVIFITFIFVKNNKVYSSIYEKKYIKIKIEEGDTLWNIAIKTMPEEYDVRKMVFEIMELNQMENPYIYPGDLIKVPSDTTPNKKR